MSDEQFHEFQLDGKQLVFLFMAATVVAVVIFLCGVMVGRGVRSPASNAAEFSAASAPLDPTAASVLDPTGTAARDLPADNDAEDLTYAKELRSAAPALETLREPEPASGDPVSPALPPPAPAAEPPAPKASDTADGASPGVYAVQVMTVTRRAEADAVVRRLRATGYPAFLLPMPDKGFRVRVGKYPDRKQAEAVRRRLQKQEKYRNAWVPPVP
jgi:cell division septation protein DedD